MLNRTIFTIAGAIFFTAGFAQDKALTLQECLQKAEMNHPVSDQAEYLASSMALKIKNLNKNYLPEMNVNGDVHYQSEVTEVPVLIPQFKIEALDKDWYKISLDVSQMIFDGNLTRRSKEVETLDNMISQQNVGIEIYGIKERVTYTYFNILALQEQRTLLELHRETLQSRLNEVESGVRYGTLLASNADILQAELLKIDQKIAENEIGIASAYKILSLLIGEEVISDTPLDLSAPDITLTENGLDRLEFGLFSMQQQKTESLKKVASSRLMPRLIAYGQAGYGRPGLDMLKNEFADFYIVGAKLSWNFWDWNKAHNEKAILDLNSNIIQSNRGAFNQNISIELERKQSEIFRFMKLIEKDEEIASIRARIVETYDSQLKNGVITSTEYITELNAETEALLNLKIHQIQLVKAKYDYLATAGKL